MQVSSAKDFRLDFKENIDTGIILEQNWMLYEIAKKFSEGRLIYSFSIDRDLYILEKDGRRFVFLQSQGASPTACYVEEMRKRNVKKIFRIGTCGALQKDIDIGDVVLSLAAIRDEGTSDQYVAKCFPSVCDPHIVADFQTKLMNRKVPTHVGITWTTDGRFVESNEKILEFSRLNVKNVDMETSAFLIVSWIHNIPSLSIGIVTDRPIDDIGKKFKGKIRNLSKSKEMLTKVLFEIISLIMDLRE